MLIHSLWSSPRPLSHGRGFSFQQTRRCLRQPSAPVTFSSLSPSACLSVRLSRRSRVAPKANHPSSLGWLSRTPVVLPVERPLVAFALILGYVATDAQPSRFPSASFIPCPASKLPVIIGVHPVLCHLPESPLSLIFNEFASRIHAHFTTLPTTDVQWYIYLFLPTLSSPPLVHL